MEPILTRRRLKPGTYLLALVILCSGIIIGLSLAPALLGPRLMGFLRGHPPRPHEVSGDIINRYQLEGQAALNVQRIVGEAYLRLENSRQRHFAELKKEVANLKKSIATQIPPRDQQRWINDCREFDRLIPPQHPRPGEKPPQPPPPPGR